MKPSGIGGQAVIEGVMMKNKSEYAVAVRKPDKTIEVKKDVFVGLGDRMGIFKIPVLRGVASFVDSLCLGMKTLSYSAGFDEDGENNDNSRKPADDKKESIIMGITMAFAIVLAVAIFVLLPFYIMELFKKQITSHILRSIIEGVIRLVLFVLYVRAITLMQDVKRVYMYHGAEHKVINCIEQGLELTVANAKKSSKEHKRCGTSFLLYVVILSIIFFAFIDVNDVWIRMILRLVLVPVVAGVAYEFIRLAGRTNNAVLNALSKPGLWLQGLTTTEPDEDMLEVAIASVEAVFDWKAYQSGDVRRNTMTVESYDDKKSVNVANDTKKNVKVSSAFEEVTFDDDEDDEILKALDKFFVMDNKGSESGESESDDSEK